MGGDEFMLILPETAPNEAVPLAEKLRLVPGRQVCAAIPSGPSSFPIHASFGIAAYPNDAGDAETLIAGGQPELYVSKRRGGDCVTGGEAGSPSGALRVRR